MRKIIKTIIFLIIFCIILCIISKILWLKPTPISYFYNEPKNSLDIIYIGSSSAYYQFNSVLAYNMYGYTTGFLSAETQPFVFTKYMIKEAEKYQNPSLYVIDLTRVVNNMDEESETMIRKTTDSMKFNKNRIDAINEMLSYKKEINKKDYINYYFSFLLYHNSWSNIGKMKVNIIGLKELYKGYLLRERALDIEIQEKYEWTDSVLELQPENKQILMSLIEGIKANNINVIFVIPNRYFDEISQARFNYVIKILQENELDVINCNELDELNNIDFNTDFYDYGHLNVYGQTKYTLWFSKYLKENYNLPDHRNDVRYSSWDSEYKRFKDNFKKLTDRNFDDLLLEYTNN